jgi:dienelactone hydrolase
VQEESNIRSIFANELARKPMMNRLVAWVAAVVLFACCSVGKAQEIIQFPSFDDNGPGQPATMLNGYLFRAAAEGPRPAIVGLHGCSGMLSLTTGSLTPLYRAWAAELNRAGYTVLLVDSLGSRHHGETCSIQGFDSEIYRKRPRDAYGALQYLQAQPFVSSDRIGLIGWSQGGGIALRSIAVPSAGRPATPPQGDFRAAVAFYPGACDERRYAAPWTTAIPLLVLLGAEDVWTPLAPCKQFLDSAMARGVPVEMTIYPGAYHAFDAPNRAIQKLPQYVTRAGVVPIVGTDSAARADALARVPAFLGRFLGN